MQLIPIGESAQEYYGILDLLLTDEENDELPLPLVELCTQLSSNGPIAYIEAEIFGGVGTQAYVFIDDKGKMSTSVVADRAINEALRLLGVRPTTGHDEFASIGLGQHRDTNGWLNGVFGR